MAKLSFITKETMELMALNHRANELTQELIKMNVNVHNTMIDFDLRHARERVKFLEQVVKEAKEVS